MTAAAVPAAAAPSRAYLLDNPAQVLVLKDGTLLVAERGTHDRLLRVNPATTVFARGIGEPWGLAYARDGSLLVSSTNGLYRLRAHSRPARIAAMRISPFAVLADGRVRMRTRPRSACSPAARRTLGLSPSTPRTVLRSLPDGALALSDTGNNRILRIDPATGTSTVVTSAVATVLGLVAEPVRTLLTVEYRSGRLLRVDPTGSVRVVARGLHSPYALARASGGIVYVTEAGSLSQPTGTIRQILPNGRSSVLRLGLPRTTMSTVARRPVLQQPFDLLPLAGGTFVVTDLRPTPCTSSTRCGRRAASSPGSVRRVSSNV